MRLPDQGNLEYDPQTSKRRIQYFHESKQLLLDDLLFLMYKLR